MLPPTSIRAIKLRHWHITRNFIAHYENDVATAGIGATKAGFHTRTIQSRKDIDDEGTLGVNNLKIVYGNAVQSRSKPRIIAMSKPAAVAYYRTSSAANVGADKDSERRQREAVVAYAKGAKLDVTAEFYDAAVSGADPVDTRAGFVALLAHCAEHDVSVVLVENASRFARDLAVQLTGHALLRGRGIELVPVDAPTHFTDPTPTAEMVRQILGAVSQFEKASLVAKLKGARVRVKAATGHCEGRKAVPAEVVAHARRLARKNPKTGATRSLREIADELAALGHFGPSGKPYFPGSIKAMLAA
jgi:DNA invertase Pin-like site-specific DNA recombinase